MNYMIKDCTECIHCGREIDYSEILICDVTKDGWICSECKDDNYG